MTPDPHHRLHEAAPVAGPYWVSIETPHGSLNATGDTLDELAHSVIEGHELLATTPTRSIPDQEVTAMASPLASTRLRELRAIVDDLDADAAGSDAETTRLHRQVDSLMGMTAQAMQIAHQAMESLALATSTLTEQTSAGAGARRPVCGEPSPSGRLCDREPGHDTVEVVDGVRPCHLAPTPDGGYEVWPRVDETPTATAPAATVEETPTLSVDDWAAVAKLRRTLLDRKPDPEPEPLPPAAVDEPEGEVYGLDLDGVTAGIDLDGLSPTEQEIVRWLYEHGGPSSRFEGTRQELAEAVPGAGKASSRLQSISQLVRRGELIAERGERGATTAIYLPVDEAEQFDAALEQEAIGEKAPPPPAAPLKAPTKAAAPAPAAKGDDKPVSPLAHIPIERRPFNPDEVRSHQANRPWEAL